MRVALRPTPFDQIPWNKFWSRAFPIVVGLAPIWIALLGGLAQRPEFKGHLFAEDVDQYSMMGAGFRAFSSLGDVAIRPPMACLSGTAQSNFTQAQCDRFWDRAFTHGGLILAVLVGWFAVVLFFRTFFENSYRAAQRTCLSAVGAIQAKAVGEARRSPNALMGWLLDWRPIEAKSSTGQVIIAWTPIDGQRISVGDAVLVTPWKKILGKQHYLLERHLPQMAIIQGASSRGSNGGKR